MRRQVGRLYGGGGGAIAPQALRIATGTQYGTGAMDDGTTDAVNGIAWSLAAGVGAGNIHPNTGLCYSWALKDVLGADVSSIPKFPFALVISQLRERTADFTDIVLGLAFGNDADPNLCTEGFGGTVEYAAGGTLRRTGGVWCAAAGTWTDAQSTAGHLDHRGAQIGGDHLNTTTFDDTMVYPLDSAFEVAAVVGSNRFASATNRVISEPTHVYAFAGRLVGATGAAAMTMDHLYWYTPKTGG